MTTSDAPVERLERLFSRLSRSPDFDAPELMAYDAADVMLLQAAMGWRDTASQGRHSLDGRVAVIGDRHGPRHSEQSSALRAVCPDPASGSAGKAGEGLVVIGDRHGALTIGAIHELDAHGVRVYQDPLLHERALLDNARRLGVDERYVSHAQLEPELVRGATLVLMQLPRSLAELEEIAWFLARYAEPEVTVFAGGRDKHMSRSMNEVLGRAFDEVTAGRGWRKSRVLTASRPRAEVQSRSAPTPTWGADPDVPFRLAAYGATFGGATFDHGSRLLARTLRDSPPAGAPSRIVDLGCGNGVLAVCAALAFPNAEILATDQSIAAVRATTLTAHDAGVAHRVTVHRADGTEAVPSGWADLILLNPPFHSGSTVHTGVAHRLIRSAADALAPGGELRLVFNSTLGYRPLVERAVGATQQLARDRTFTVLSARKEG